MEVKLGSHTYRHSQATEMRRKRRIVNVCCLEDESGEYRIQWKNIWTVEEHRRVSSKRHIQIFSHFAEVLLLAH